MNNTRNATIGQIPAPKQLSNTRKNRPAMDIEIGNQLTNS